MPAARDPLERFWEKVDRSEDGCWLWTGATTWGYGVMRLRQPRRQVRSHRFAYEQFVGPIPEGLDLDHLCRNRACVNPEHLEPVTRRTNLLRGDTIVARCAAATECPRGHPYDDDNTYHRPDGRGRDCRECRALRKLVHPGKGRVTASYGVELT